MNSYKKCETAHCYKVGVNYGYCLTCWNGMSIEDRNRTIRTQADYGKWQLDDLDEAVIDNVESQKMDGAYFHPDLAKMTAGDLFHMNTFGVYFPPKDRAFYAGTVDGRNDGKPKEASVAVKSSSNFNFSFVGQDDKGYFSDLIANGTERSPAWAGIKQHFIYLRKIKKPQRGIFSSHEGDWYSLLWGKVAENLSSIGDGLPQKEGVFYEKYYIKINFDSGEVNPAIMPGMSPKKDRVLVQELRRRTTVLASMALSAEADSKYLWHVRAFRKESSGQKDLLAGNIRFGVYGEHVKSLFFARDLPLTETGRKKPILHWVKAHQRRIKSGEDIDIDTYLRGSRLLQVGDTVFAITKPCEKENDEWLDFSRKNSLWVNPLLNTEE